MSTNTPKQNPASESPDSQSLGLLDSELSGPKKLFLFLFVVAVVASLTWVILRYAVYPPNNNAAKLREEKQREQLEKIAAEKNQQRALTIKLEKERKAEVARQEKLKLEKAEKERNQKLQRRQRLQRIKRNTQASNSAIKAKNWKLAERYIGELQDDQHDLVEVAELLTRLEQGKVEEREIIIRVGKLLDQAKRLDTGAYSAEAIAYLDEALLLHPGHTATTILKQKIEAYTSEFRIPEDYKSIAEVLPRLRAGDTILLSKGVYKTPAIFNLPVHIKGAGREHTVLECDTTKSSALVFQGNAVKNRTYTLSGLTIRGTTYQDFNIDRFPLVLVKAEVSIDDTLIEMSSGHGIAILSGTLHLTNSEITGNAWDGVSVKGSGAKAHIKKCKIHTNHDHGVDFWDDASGSVIECDIYQHSGSGIVVMGNKAHAIVEQVKSYKNEQCGIVIMNKGSAQLASVTTTDNKMSGVVVQGKEAKAELGMVISNNNKEAGFYLDPASQVKGYQHTTSEGNIRGNLVRKALEFSVTRNAE